AFEHRFIPEITADRGDPRYRNNFKQIHGDDATGPPDALDEGLRPAARRGAEIDDGIAGMCEPVPLQEFEQLEGRTRPVPLRFRPVDIGIIHVAPEPGAAGFAAGHSLDFPRARIITRPAVRIEGP